MFSLPREGNIAPEFSLPWRFSLIIAGFPLRIRARIQEQGFSSMIDSPRAKIGFRAFGAACLALVLGTDIAAAQEGPAAELVLGSGVSISPSYFGSNEYDVGPDARVRFNYLRVPGLLSFGSAQDDVAAEGFGLRGAFRYIGSRRPSDDDSLQGTERIDRSLELGIGLGYEAEDWRAFGEVRYGVLGHNAWVGEAGADALFRPRNDLLINLGPRAHFGSDRFMDTYFGVSGEEAAASPELDEFSASGGLYAVGVEVGARYAFSESWGLEGAASYDRLVEDAGDSPITDAGSRDQFGIRLGITRTIRLGF